ncbi:MAG: hypothetical protein GY805_06925, partial [Chloroflexi bacterium]|nr:hypothetical protein [Chloroflexota bacterium]
VNLFHHGTARENGRLVTSRGRVLAVTAVAQTLSSALQRAYRGVDKISFSGMQYRRDIGDGIAIRLQHPPVLSWGKRKQRVGMGTAV